MEDEIMTVQRIRFLMVVALVALVSAFCAVANGALVLQWKFDDGSGTSAADSTGNGHAGTLNNMEGGDWINTGLPSVPSGTTYALNFDGTNEYVIASGDSYKGVTGTAERTIAAWIKTTKLNAAIANWGANSAGQKWTFRTQNSNGTAGALRVEVNGGYQVGNTVITDNSWRHVAAVLPSHTTPNVNQIRLYVDGVLQGISAVSGQAINTASSQNFRVARNFNNSHYFNGPIDEVRLYDNALTGADVRVLAGVAAETYSDVVLADSPVAYWRLGEDTGAKAFNEGSIGPDVDSTYGGLAAGHYGQTSLVATSTNTSVNFDGGNNRVDIPDNNQINNTGAPYSKKTIETWFVTDAFPSGTNRRVIYEQGGTGNGLNQYVRLDGGNYYLYYGAWENDGTARDHFPTRVQVTPGDTYHAVSVFDADNDMFVLYLDGAPVSGKVGSTIENIGSATGDVAIGAKRDATKFDSGNSTSNGNYFDGRIDDVSLYNNALTLRQVQTHYEAGSGDRLQITAGATLGVALNYDAANDADGDTTFEDSIGARTNGAAQNNFDWNLAGMTDPARKSITSTVMPRLTRAYRFDGTDTATTDTLENVAGDPTLFSASFEIVFNPDDFTGHEALFESGGTTDGLSIRLDGTTLRFEFRDGGQNAKAFWDLTNLSAGEQSDFIHAVGVADLDNDQAILYVNGTARHTAAGTGTLLDWSGSDGAGLGSVNAAINFGSPVGFDGDIALLRFYPSVLDSTDVTANFNALVPEPSALLLATMGLLGLAAFARRQNGSTKDEGPNHKRDLHRQLL